MGEYADIALEQEMYHGSSHRSDRPRRRKLVSCPNCGKECRGEAGVMQHQNAKHETTHTWGQINMVKSEYE